MALMLMHQYPFFGKEATSQIFSFYKLERGLNLVSYSILDVVHRKKWLDVVLFKNVGQYITYFIVSGI